MRTLLIFKTIKWKFIFSIFTLIFLTTFCNEVFGQNKITVKGMVRDKTTHEVMSGVSISTGKPLKGIGLTNEKGAFEVAVKSGAELVFTFVDHETFRKVVVSNESNLEINLSPKSGAMKEVVVQGFKSLTREVATGSSTIIKGTTIQDVPVSNVIQLLQGKVAGLNIQNNTGSPGGMGTINLRGISSIQVSSDGFLTPTSPLFVIDGVPVDLNTNYQYGFQSGGPGINPMSLIPPEDIEQIDVLKDAAATSQYGSRGAYGVILITTKRGKSKIPIVRYSGNFFMSTVPKLRDVIGGKEERTSRINSILSFDTSVLAAQALINQTAFLSDSLNPFYNNSTDWQRYFFRNTFNQQHNISISGGDSKFNYNTNMNYYQESGIVQNTGFKRYSFSMNALYQPTSAFRMLVTLSSGLGLKQNGSGVGLVQTGVASGPSTSSLLPPPSLFSANNEALATSRVNNSNKSDNISTSLDLQYEPIKGIRFGNLLSYSYNSSTSEIFTPSFLNNSISKAYSYNDRTYTIYDRSTLTFIKSINDIHNFSAFLFNEINSYGFRANAIQLEQTANDQITGPIGYASSLSGGGTLNNLSDTRQEAYGASFSYNYDRKYVIDFDYRLDGLSTNGPSQGYSQNPAISVRWNFNKEKLFDNASWLSYGALRGSWGRNITPTGSIFDVYGKYVIGARYNNDPTVSIDFTNIPNTDFKPKTQTESNIGLEVGLWNNSVEATFETYYRSIDNQVMSVDLANINGFKQLQTNAVSLVDYGFEWTGTFRIFKQSHPLQWSLSVNGALSRDVLTKLPNDLRQMTVQIADGGGNVPIIYKMGRNSLSNLLLNTEGVYANTTDVPVNIATGRRQQLGAGSSFYFQGGDPRWTDVNGDYVIDDNDLLPIGNPVPRITGGINSLTSYKRFQLNVNITYTLKRDLLNTSLAQMFQNYTNPTSATGMLPIDKYSYWKPGTIGKPGGTAKAQYPNPFDFRRAPTLQAFRTNQTLFLEDGSYWKINNIVLSYNFDPKSLSRWGMTSLRLTLTANNVYTFSNYSGPDPELVTALGRDNSNGYPNARSYAVGVGIQF